MIFRAVGVPNVRGAVGAAVAMLLLAVSLAPVARADAPLPTIDQALGAFQDEWGPADFEPTGVSFYEPESAWRRVDQYVFAPGTDEFTARPVRQTSLRRQRVEIYRRHTPGGLEYNVVESTTMHSGKVAVNRFPKFQGTPESMVFYNAIGAHEKQKRCRDLVKDGRHFQVCRVIRDNGALSYHTKVREGEPATGLPSLNQMLNAFRDQWGHASFEPTGITVWRPVSKWTTESGVVLLPEGADEVTGTREVVNPGIDSTLIDWTFFRRFVDDVPEVQMSLKVIVPGQDEPIFSDFSPFTGNVQDAVQQDEEPANGGPPEGERRHSRILRVNGEDFLIVRVVHSNGIVNYWIARRID